MDQSLAVLLTIITAATPLLIAAMGELVVERSGVLNLGVEGMMVMGAVAGFAVAFMTGSTLAGGGGRHLRRGCHVGAVWISDTHAGGQPGGGGAGAYPPGAWTFRPGR